MVLQTLFGQRPLKSVPTFEEASQKFQRSLANASEWLPGSLRQAHLQKCLSEHSWSMQALGQRQKPRFRNHKSGLQFAREFEELPQV